MTINYTEIVASEFMMVGSKRSSNSSGNTSSAQKAA